MTAKVVRAGGRGLLLAFLITAAFSLAEDHLPLPQKLISARTVFIQNDSGDPKLGDAMYSTLRDWGRWSVVTDRSEADLIAVVDHKDIFIHNNFTLTILDAKSSERLWSSKHDAAISIRGKISRELISELRKRLPAAQK